MELDNQLPKWWLGLFYFGVAYCVLYITSYFLTDFAHPIKEYDQEYKEQIAAVDEYMKTVPQATIETAKFSEDNVEEGKVIFQNASQVALATFQKEMSGEAKKVGFKSEEDLIDYINEIRKDESK